MSHPSSRRAALLLGILISAALAACGGGGDGGPAPATSTDAVETSFSPSAALGAKIYSDVSLSASGRQSCATCHSPDNAHGPTNDFAVQLGGPNGDVPGFRASPDGTPVGGFDRDGRARTLEEQAERPFVAPHEMANTTKADVVARLKQAAYAAQFRATFGDNIFDNVDQAFNRATFALQQFENEDPRFHPFDSKYDAFLAGKAKLSDAELRGLALFNDPNKGNCAACHTSARGADGSTPLFTDFSYDNLGVPRNARIPATLDAVYFDLGLCGPDRTDLAARTDLCGAFKVPTLRNVATRKVFFHNGAFTNLTDVVRFYVTRDTNPERWYPLNADGTVDKFNDLPPTMRKNVNTTEVPYNRQPGMAPALDEAEIADLVQFLGTLNDGYRP
jgi:cytochrome c peroxidase